ncbi:glycosyltransferase family 2 protein [Pseudoflavitalea sp. X16]|uniref:glycosyltransferase family A protein n=1 Tax=Paraflavitalea devenefica TaxID=2716334 RepID=UPI00141F1AFC|nr:glycosyltransferase family A protein [Paraflavitalea devenefica]NII27267.1 glycosyltransferase family 2 protein [Paraflavitalea devenefica]
MADVGYSPIYTMDISVVIPTCNRKQRVLLLLQNLHQSVHPIREVIIVDSGEDRLSVTDLAAFPGLSVHYLSSEKSVCIQRNKGIQMAGGEWIFLCDDDIEMPADYLQKIADHVAGHPEAGAVSGLVMQWVADAWKADYAVHSPFALVWSYVFKLSIWGQILCGSNNLLVRRVTSYYQRKGNHITKAGWPVVTNFNGAYFSTPVYGLGASVIRKEWLLRSPYEEVLDRHGIGDNYGVSVGFPATGVHVLNDAFVYHHQAPENRLRRPLTYYRRMLALHYFMKTKTQLRSASKTWLLWSLTGNILSFIRMRDGAMVRAAMKTFWQITWEKNPYYKAAKANKKVVEPVL